jgi:hypothetical protein
MSQRSAATTALVTHGAASSMTAPAPNAANVPGNVATRKWPPVPNQSNGVITGTGLSRVPGEWLRNDSHQNG